MANGTYTEQLGTSIHHSLYPNQQKERAQFGLDNTSQKVEIPQPIDIDKVKIDAKTIRQWHKLAKKGIAWAQYNLGLAYSKGDGVKPDDEKAVYWYHKAAEHGIAEAQYNLGNAYHKGEGVKPDDEKAVYWLHKAAEHGIAEAQYNLGFAYHKGEGVKADDEKAVYWLHKAAEQGDAQAQNELGLVYHAGEAVKQDYEKAVDWYHKAAKQGYAPAQYNLGVVYYEGEAVKQDDEKAVDWYHKAAEQGYAPAQYNLAIAYDRGEGVEQDDKKAIYWYHEAAKQGDDKALHNLLKMNGGGKITVQFYLAKIYDEQGKEILPLLCKVAAGLVSLEEDDDDIANFFIQFFDKEKIDYLNKKITQGNVVAQVILAQLYKTGNGVQKDKQQAFSWFQTAAEQKDILAQYCLGLAYMEGQGTIINSEKAREQFQKIINQLKEQKAFSYVKFSFETEKNKEKFQDYPHDIKQWIGLVARDKLSLLDERAARQQLAIEKQKLEDIMAIVAHKFRGALISLDYNVRHQNKKPLSLDSIQTMRGLLNLFDIISRDSERLCQALSQDMHGECTLTSVLEKSLSLAFSQLLTQSNRDKIIQHHLFYAKKTGKVSQTTTRKQWRNNNDKWKQLQTEWETSFMQLPEPNLENIVKWASTRLFPIEISGFDNNPIQFQRYAITESVLMIVITEIILNAIKYYYSETNKPLKLRWKCQKDICRFTCENPTSKDEPKMGKGSYKGRKFLQTLSTKLGGDFSVSTNQNDYVVDFSFPTHLLTTEVL